jgi:hypothetical protein
MTTTMPAPIRLVYHYCRNEILAIILPIVVFFALFMIFYYSFEHRKSKRGLFDLSASPLDHNYYRVRDPSTTAECSLKNFSRVYAFTRKRKTLVWLFGILFLAALFFLLLNVYYWLSSCRASVPPAPPAPCLQRMVEPRCGANFPNLPRRVKCTDLIDDSQPFEPIAGVLAFPRSKSDDVTSLALRRHHRTTFSVVT